MLLLAGIIVFTILLSCKFLNADIRPPVFLLNGILGAKLYITEHNVQYPKELGCEPSEKYRKIWISASVSNIPIYGDRACEFFRLSPVFNESTNMFHDRPGVNISTPFADLDALECLASDNFIGSCYVGSSFVSAYYYKFIEHAKSVYNFTPEYNLIGAAYDWRYPPDAQKQFFASLTLEIERRVNATSLPAIFVAHSMGNKVLNYFLTRETTAEWRKRYINMTINVAPAFGGSVATMQELLTGNPIQWLGLGLDQETVRNFTRAVPSVASLLPSQNVFNTSRSLLTVAEGLKNFTSGNMLEFLSFINSSHLAVHYGKSEEKQQDVPMLVIIGNKTDSTPSRYMYSKSSEEPIGHHVANGDGRMEAATIEELCNRWKKNGASIEMKELPLEHTELIMSEKFFDIFGKAVVGKLPDGEYYPVLRNVMLDRGDSLCFSAKSHATCPSRKSVKILRAREVASFVCFHKSSKMAVYLKKSVAENMIFDLSEFAVTFSTMIDVAEKCADL